MVHRNYQLMHPMPPKPSKMKYRILLDRERTIFYPQRKGWIFWKYYDGHPYMPERFAGTFEQVVEIIDEDAKKRDEDWDMWFGLKLGGIISAVLCVIFILLRYNGMI